MELVRLGLVDWQVDHINSPFAFEFHAWLQRGGLAATAVLSETELNDRRIGLLKRTMAEAKEQIECLMPTRFQSAALENEETMVAGFRREIDQLRTELALRDEEITGLRETAGALEDELVCNTAIAKMASPLFWLKCDGYSREVVYSFIGERARNARLWRLATRFCRKALRRDSENPLLWREHGHALEALGEPSEAEGAFRKADRSPRRDGRNRC